MKRHGWQAASCDLCDCPIRETEWMWATRDGERAHYSCKYPDRDPGPVPEREKAIAWEDAELLDAHPRPKTEAEG